MGFQLADEFLMMDWQEIELLTDKEKYERIVNWALKARGRNPGVFDALTEWVLDDSQWTRDKLEENRQILINGVFARFKEQNARLRAALKQLEPGIVNVAVFSALDGFDEQLSGIICSDTLADTVARVFADFSEMLKRGVRELIAGNRTGPTGTDTVDIFGYINCLKDSDASVQWALFMPDVVKRQQDGFRVESFEYVKLPAIRFIGREGEELADITARKALFQTLDNMGEYASEFNHDILFMHHNGQGVDVGEWHGVWGRFMRAGAPVPEGFQHFDFIPEDDGQAGTPYISQFAFAQFSGDVQKMHAREGFDSDAMYDVTRNIILGQNVCIPYPNKYWTAEVFPDGCDRYSTAYLFSVLR